MVDAFDAEEVEGDADVPGAGADGLAGVARQPEAGAPGQLERRLERRQVDAQLGRIHADSDDPLGAARPAQGDEQLDEFEPGGRPVGAIHVGDQRGSHPGVGLGRRDPRGQPVDDAPEIVSGGEVARGREERLAVAQPVGRGVDQRFVRDPLPVRGLDERLLDQPEDGQEGVERRVAVQLRGVLDGQWPPGLPCELEHRPGPHGALDVAVQLDLGDRVVQVAHRRRS